MVESCATGCSYIFKFRIYFLPHKNENWPKSSKDKPLTIYIFLFTFKAPHLMEDFVLHRGGSYMETSLTSQQWRKKERQFP